MATLARETRNPIFNSVVVDLKIRPVEEVRISHEERFQKIMDAHKSKLLINGQIKDVLA